MGSDLVRRSAGWSLPDITLTCSRREVTCSQTKWKSISICFIWAWKIGLAER